MSLTGHESSSKCLLFFSFSPSRLPPAPPYFPTLSPSPWGFETESGYLARVGLNIIILRSPLLRAGSAGMHHLCLTPSAVGGSCFMFAPMIHGDLPLVQCEAGAENHSCSSHLFISSRFGMRLTSYNKPHTHHPTLTRIRSLVPTVHTLLS